MLCFGSADSKGVMGVFFGSADSKGVRSGSERVYGISEAGKRARLRKKAVVLKGNCCALITEIGGCRVRARKVAG